MIATDWHAWLTLALILGQFGVMLKTKLPADVVFFVVVILLVLTGCLPLDEALNGFASPMVVVFGVLCVVVTGLEATGVLHWAVKNLLGEPSSYWRAIVRLMLPVAVMSSVLNNVTVVALFIKMVKMWAAKLGISPSKMLIPLSYAAGMGGVCTLIGTAPNLVVSGFYADQTGEPLGIFSTTLPGLFCLAVGVVSVIALQKLLPERKLPEEELSSGKVGTTTELHVLPGSHLPGQTLADVGLVSEETSSNERVGRLLGIVRFDGEVNEAKPDEFLMGGDTLIFTGDKKAVLDIGKKLGMECDPIDRGEEISVDHRTILSSLIMVGMVMLSAFNVLPLPHCCFLAALMMLVTRCCSVAQAKKAINWDVLIIIACSITLGKAIESTGIDKFLAAEMANICDSNALVALVLVCLIGTFLTEFISNTACAAIMAPIAIEIATALEVNPMTFCIALMISASSSFATPVGSATHLLVYATGGYRFSDFLRIGLPMNFIILAANIFIVTLLFPL